MHVLNHLLVLSAVLVCDCQLLGINRFRKLYKPSGFKLKQRLQQKINQYRQRSTETICYDIVGCFELPHSRSPLQKTPENPETLDTKFYLFKRNANFSHPEVLYYNDDSLTRSKFNYSQPLKMIIHGYMGKWNDIGNIMGADAYLKLYDCNMVLMDWSVGARGPQYATAAANSEVVGRQLGILLSKMVKNGLDPQNIHLLGFSLGAHVAGTSSELLKKNRHLIERITGLDAASPLFRTNHLRENHKKLDIEDAKLVDVIHTDSSPSITDGFGLWKPIGHVDFFPNGGQEQPGCTDTKQSVVVSTFDKTLTREIACSHIRAWHLFLETLLNKVNKNNCEFTAYNCPGGLSSFERAFCFPHLPHQNSSFALDDSYRSEIGRFGEDVKGSGVMFFVTKAAAPYCGTQLQASVFISQKTGPAKGFLQIDLQGSHPISFAVTCEIDDLVMNGAVMSGLAVAHYESLKHDTLEARLRYTNFASEDENDTHLPLIHFDKILIRDMYSNSWQFCGRDIIIEDSPGKNYGLNLTLSRNKFCS